MDKFYSGIGSRETPLPVLNDMKEIANILQATHILRSGGAGGADSAFESGAGDRKEIYLPFNGFNGRQVDNEKFFVFTSDAMKLAPHYHPAWKRCDFAARRFHARNCHQVLGLDLKTPVDFVICYTERGLIKGGTATAIRIAKDNDIPVFNLGKLSKNDVLYLIRDYLK